VLVTALAYLALAPLLAGCGGSSNSSSTATSATGSTGASAGGSTGTTSKTGPTGGTSHSGSTGTTSKTGPTGGTSHTGSTGTTSKSRSAGGSTAPAGKTLGSATRSPILAEAKRLSRYAACLRRHGLAVPSPRTSSTGATLNLKQVDTASATYRTAQRRCAAKLAGGIDFGRIHVEGAEPGKIHIGASK